LCAALIRKKKGISEREKKKVCQWLAAREVMDFRSDRIPTWLEVSWELGEFKDDFEAQVNQARSLCDHPPSRCSCVFRFRINLDFLRKRNRDFADAYASLGSFRRAVSEILFIFFTG
jgi:hypothetical protein